MLNTLTATVTEKDLEQAIQQSVGGASCLTNCVLAVASQRQIPNAASVGFNSVHSNTGSLGYYKERADCLRLTGAFDEERFDDVRSMLPLTLTFIYGDN